ncbi:MAG: 2-amino-4-hydroxy-6-hydroxymethyldihydropteridine diphosphokinase [Deltaproteobacteria bacterium]|nr:2-amino-4-hydroxy-6-hydroxymethyldihydropteridine diphosphokinase [Deltaproteobacteria bacterium]
MSEERVYIGVGSNLGDRRRNCERAIEYMERLPHCRTTGCSGWYLTRPVGVEGQDWFVNGVASLETTLAPEVLLDGLLAIEEKMGRTRKEHWGPRIIDLDLLLYGQQVIETEHLKIPHPLMHQRRFVLIPMVDLAPELKHPLLDLGMVELLRQCPEGRQQVIPVTDGTGRPLSAPFRNHDDFRQPA